MKFWKWAHVYNAQWRFKSIIAKLLIKFSVSQKKLEESSGNSIKLFYKTEIWIGYLNNWIHSLWFINKSYRYFISDERKENHKNFRWAIQAIMKKPYDYKEKVLDLQLSICAYLNEMCHKQSCHLLNKLQLTFWKMIQILFQCKRINLGESIVFFEMKL